MGTVVLEGQEELLRCSGCDCPMYHTSFIAGHIDAETGRPLSFLLCRACGRMLREHFGLTDIVPRLGEVLAVVAEGVTGWPPASSHTHRNGGTRSPAP